MIFNRFRGKGKGFTSESIFFNIFNELERNKHKLQCKYIHVNAGMVVFSYVFEKPVHIRLVAKSSSGDYDTSMENILGVDVIQLMNVFTILKLYDLSSKCYPINLLNDVYSTEFYVMD